MCVQDVLCVCTYVSTAKDVEIEGDIHFWTVEACFSKVTIRKCPKILQVKELSFKGSEYWYTRYIETLFLRILTSTHLCLTNTMSSSLWHQAYRVLSHC